MTGPANAPRLIRGGIVLVDPRSGQVLRVIALQYNPDTLTRTLQPQSGDGRRATARRRCGSRARRSRRSSSTPRSTPPTSSRSRPEPGRGRSSGISPQLAALETMLYPTERAAASRTTRCRPVGHARDRADGGAADAVRLEQASGSCRCASPTSRSPRRRSTRRSTRSAPRSACGMRVLTVDDLGFDHKGGSAVHRSTSRPRSGSRPERRGGARPTLGLSGDPVTLAMRRMFAAQQPLPRRRRRHARAARRRAGSPTCAAAFVPPPERSPCCGSTSSRRASDWTPSPRSTWATRSSSGASPTPTARCAGGADRRASAAGSGSPCRRACRGPRS